MVQIKHFTDYLYSRGNNIPFGEAKANNWLQKHPEIEVKDVQTNYDFNSQYGHSGDLMHITIVFDAPDDWKEKQNAEKSKGEKNQ